MSVMKKVLVVDDNREIARFLAKLLKQEGYEVDTFFDSEKALEAILTHDYDCVVSDGEMPFMSGPHLMQETLKQKPSMKDRFVFQTASPFAIISALRDVGKATVLNKPIHRSDLLDAVTQVLKTC
jgi:CheY-like chemotaxis protein